MNDSLVMVCMQRWSAWEAGTANRNRHLFEAAVRSKRFKTILLIDVPARNWQRGVRVLFEDLLLGRHGRVVARGLLWKVTEVRAGVYVLTSLEHLWSSARYFRRINRLIETLNMRRPLLWSYVPTMPEFFTAVTHTASVFDAVDDWSEHPAYRRQRAALNDRYASIGANAGKIVTVSRQLLEKFPAGRAVWVPNGVDVEHFALRTEAHSGPPVIGYVGMIQERFDVRLVARLAALRPAYAFEVIGWIWKGIDVSPLRRLPNVTLTGIVPYDRLPRMLQRWSGAMIPHVQDGLVRSMNPLKLYEYLAAGLPVVTTEQPDFSQFPGVTTAASPEAFAAALDDALAHPPDPESLRAFVRPMSWDARFHDIMRLLETGPATR